VLGMGGYGSYCLRSEGGVKLLITAKWLRWGIVCGIRRVVRMGPASRELCGKVS